MRDFFPNKTPPVGADGGFPGKFLCFARKVCHFAVKGLPLGLQETISGFSERSTGVDERAT
jgi:hypothetical protein